MLRLVKAAAKDKSLGRTAVNILLYGAHGAGKTEFARTVGQGANLPVRFVGEFNDEKAEPLRRERIAALTIANAIASVVKNVILVVDEADDLFSNIESDDRHERQGSKVFMNRLLESMVAPTIWIANDVSSLGPATVRRMNLVLRFPTPNYDVRARMTARIAESHNFVIDELEVAHLASFVAPPALLNNAISVTQRVGGDIDDAQQILESSLRALGGRIETAQPIAQDFDPALCSADIDLVALAQKLRKARTSAVSFCLSGPPGTGKSAYARYVAKCLILPL